MRVSQHESSDIRRAQRREIRSLILKSVQQKPIDDGYVVFERRWGPPEFLQQIGTELGGDPGPGAVGDWRRTRIHNAFLAKQGKHPIQRFRVAATNRLLSVTMAQESIHHLVVQSLNRNLFVLQPAAEIGDDDDLPSDRVVSVALFGDKVRVGVEVFAQRTLAKPFNSAWESEELIYHPSRVSGVCQTMPRQRR